MGIGEVFVGYPYLVGQDNGNEYNVNIWWFNKVIRWLGEVLEEYGIKLKCGRMNTGLVGNAQYAA